MNTPAITRNKIISVSLAVIVLIMLFLCWTGVTGTTRKAWVFVQEQIDEYADKIEDYAEYGSYFGIDLNVKGARRVVRALKNGRLSPYELFTSSGYIRSTLNKLDSLGMSLVKDTSKVTSLATVYRVFFVLAFLAVLFSIFIRMTGKFRSLDFLMFLFILILFIIIVVATSLLKKNLNVSAAISAWSIIALICAVPFALLEKIPFLKTDAGVAAAPVVKTAGDTVSTIGATLSGLKDKAGAVIKNINIGRKETYQCSVCGHDLQASDKVCPVCRSSAEGKLNTAVCKNCGCRIPSGSKYCTMCGAKQD